MAESWQPPKLYHNLRTIEHLLYVRITVCYVSQLITPGQGSKGHTVHHNEITVLNKTK